MSETTTSGQLDPLVADLFCWSPPCVERWLPGVGPVWVHGYTGADAAKWKRAARNLARGGEPTSEQLAVAQVLWVCRTAPHGPVHTFQVDLQNARPAFERLVETLPGKWLETACQESDALALKGYFPPAEAGPPQPVAEQRLGELLADPEFWAALSTVSLKLYGVPLAENGEPLGEVVAYLREERAAGLAGAVEPLQRAVLSA